jgi:hypothetical protein
VICINIHQQTLEFEGKIYPISSAKNGVGEKSGSFCTPLGRFKIAQKIGAGLPLNSVFEARVATGEIYSPALAKKYPNRDWILSRILWLDGVEKCNQNTKSRYIYIHGAPDYLIDGLPKSKGCIRMKNQDIIELFDCIQTHEDVAIIAV